MFINKAVQKSQGAIASLIIAAIIISLLPHQAFAQTPPRTPPPTHEEMTWIPPGEFIMGTDDPTSNPNERPAHPVKLTGFWIDQHDVTNAEFKKFTQATNYVTTAEKPIDWTEIQKQLPKSTPKPPAEMLLPGSLVFTPPNHPVDLQNMSNWWTWTPGASWKHPQGPTSNITNKDQLPVVQVSYDDALAYAKWAGKQLPTEAQWEYAARGPSPKNTRYYWGDTFAPQNKFMCNTFTGDFPYHNTAQDGFAGLSPVKSFPPNAFGLYDMAGNVWQWTADFYRADAHQLSALNLQKTGERCCLNPQGPTQTFNPAQAIIDSPEHVTKGGSFLCNPTYCESYRPPARRGVPPDTATEHIGFRCAISPPER